MLDITIKEGYYLIIADHKTGHILNLDGSLYLKDAIGQKKFFLYKSTLEEIEQRAEQLLTSHAGIEVLVYNYRNELVLNLNNYPQ